MTITNESPVTGIILAGGKSSRMGYDKGLAEIDGRKIIERVYGVLKQVADQVIIISNNDAYHYMGLPVFGDIYKEKGPLSGIYTGLAHSGTERNLVVACDMPFVSVELLKNILDRSEDYDIVVPTVNNDMEPLCGFYRKEINGKLKELIEQHRLPVHIAVKNFNMLEFTVTDKEMLDAGVFTNINKPEDLEKITNPDNTKSL